MRCLGFATPWGSVVPFPLLDSAVGAPNRWDVPEDEVNPEPELRAGDGGRGSRAIVDPDAERE